MTTFTCTQYSGHGQTRDRPVHVDNDQQNLGHIPVYMTKYALRCVLLTFAKDAANFFVCAYSVSLTSLKTRATG